mmetsp:Transcript_18042/g.37673  ORF Transcript_18042/g.37673 Transcript_18042/m.37673 type:complete len:259 (-) Transcript_18042:488-1264(-)
MTIQHRFTLLQIQCILGRSRLVQTKLFGRMIVSFKNANVHLAMDGREQRKQGRETQLVTLLLRIAAKMQIFHNLRQELCTKRVCFMNWLNVLHYQYTPRFNSRKPIKDGLHHVFCQVCSIVNNDLQRRCVGAFHFVLPNSIQKGYIVGIPTMQPVFIQVLLVSRILCRKVPPRPFTLISWTLWKTSDFHRVAFSPRQEFPIRIISTTLIKANLQKLKWLHIISRIRTESLLINGIIMMSPRPTLNTRAIGTCAGLVIL